MCHLIIVYALIVGSSFLPLENKIPCIYKDITMVMTFYVYMISKSMCQTLRPFSPKCVILVGAIPQNNGINITKSPRMYHLLSFFLSGQAPWPTQEYYKCHGNLRFLSWNVLEMSWNFNLKFLWEPWIRGKGLRHIFQSLVMNIFVFWVPNTMNLNGGRQHINTAT